MGTGKTAVGQALARILHYQFIDSDREIESRQALSVQKIFESQGEPQFRKLEKETITRLAQKTDTVLSVGGGAILDPEIYSLLDRTGTLILLTASVDEISRRLGHESGRPLLVGGDRKKKIKKLMADREPVYAKVRLKVDTTGRAVDEVVQEILRKIQK